LLDIGNTRIAWACADAKGIGARSTVMHRGMPVPAALSFLRELPAVPTAAAAVNVAGTELALALAAELQALFAIDLQFYTSSASCGGVTNGYTEPEQLGADRWAALVGAWRRCRDNIVVIDAGTALTVDLVRLDGQHLGGIIVPGLALMQGALDIATADIATFAARTAQSAAPAAGDWLGASTREAVERGALFTLAALLDSASRRFPAATSAPRIVLTGGDAELLALQMLQPAVEQRPALVLEGLHYLAQAAH
jgi:type III pantothenate kinase